MDTQAPGNTRRRFRGRSYLLTLFNIESYDYIVDELTSKKTFRYLISCLEMCPKTQKKHIHIYVNFNNPYTLPQKIIDTKVHIDVCKGSPIQNINYVKKDKNIIDEIGDIPKQGVKYTVQDLKDENDINNIPWNQYNTYKKIHSEMELKINIHDWHKNITVYYISGPSGIGKSEKAKSIIIDNIDKYGKYFNEVKYVNGFWIGIGDEKIALYDDFRDSHMTASEFINFIDYNIHNLNIKGGNKKNKYELIIITSIQPLESIYKNLNDEPRKQWERRIIHINLDIENKVNQYNELDI